MRDIYVIGSMSVDLVTEAARSPKKGETLLGSKFFMTTGGKGANQAVSAARLGGRVYMVGCVGDDQFGQMILENLQANDVNIDNVETITGVASGTASITLAEGDNSIIVVPSANFEITIDQVRPVIEQAGDDSLIVLQNEIPVEVIEFVIDAAAQRDLTIIYNPAPYIEMNHELLDKVTHFTPNETEVNELFGRQYEAVISQYPQQMIVTLGKQGATYFDDELINVPALKTTVVDTTGAGDTFNGALAVALSEGQSLADAIAFGNKAAGISVTGLGAQGGMPKREEMN